MVQSSTEIANLALGHVGVTKPIGNLDVERSLEAQTCRTFYQAALDELITGASWTHCKKFATLALIAGPSPMATLEWTYAYRYPPDCLQFLRIISERLNNDTRQSRVPYEIGADSAGMLIYTDWPGSTGTPAQCQYVFRNTNIAVHPPNFVMALSYRLAKYIAPGLTAGDPFKLGERASANYDRMIQEAANSMLNEIQRPEEPASEFVRARDGGGSGADGQAWSADPSGFTVT